MENQPEEAKQHTSEELKRISEVVKQFINEHDNAKAIEYLRLYPGDTVEFCLQIRDQYKKDDPTPIVIIGLIMRTLLEE